MTFTLAVRVQLYTEISPRLNILADAIYSWTQSKGFYTGEPNEEVNLGEKIALIHSELSEALEALRHGNPPDEHCPEFSSFEIELANALIRVLDTSAQQGLDIGGAVLAKMRFNETRPHKHGKEF